jgi:hypothetical protein
MERGGDKSKRSALPRILPFVWGGSRDRLFDTGLRWALKRFHFCLMNGLIAYPAKGYFLVDTVCQARDGDGGY